MSFSRRLATSLVDIRQRCPFCAVMASQASQPSPEKLAAEGMAIDAKRWKSFLKKWTERRNATLHLFSSDGQPLVKRHAVNVRKVGVQCAKYTRGVLSHGILEESETQQPNSSALPLPSWEHSSEHRQFTGSGNPSKSLVTLRLRHAFVSKLPRLRGTIVAVPSAAHQSAADSNQHFEVVGGGTFFEACYAACTIDADNTNEHCADIKRDGVSNVIILKADCPVPELRWCKSVHNKFHSGCDDTVAERFRAVPTAKADWDKEKASKHLSKTTCPKSGPFTYEMQYKRFIGTNFSDMWARWEHYDHTKAVYNFMLEGGYCETFLDELETHVDLANRSLDSVWMVRPWGSEGWLVLRRR